MDNLFAPILMSLAITQIETYHFLFLCVKILNLVGDESNCYFCKVNKEVVFVSVLVDEEVHVVVLEDTVEIYFL